MLGLKLNHVDKKGPGLLQGADCLTTYAFNTRKAKHTFCRECGVQSFYQPRSNPDGYGNTLTYVGKNLFWKH